MRPLVYSVRYTAVRISSSQLTITLYTSVRTHFVYKDTWCYKEFVCTASVARQHMCAVNNWVSYILRYVEQQSSRLSVTMNCVEILKMVNCHDSLMT